MTLLQIIRYEFTMMFKQDKKRPMYLFGACAIYVILFGLLYSPHVVTSIPLVICDEDQTAFSRSLSQAFVDSERYTLVSVVSSTEEMLTAVNRQEAAVALNIPAAFSQNAKQGRSTGILLTVNAANLLVANSALTAAQEIVQDFSLHSAARGLSAGGQLPSAAIAKAAPVALSVRLTANPTLSYLDFFVLGLAMAALQQGIMLAAGASLLQTEPYQRPVTWFSSLRILSAKLFLYWLCGTIAFSMALSLAVWLFAIPCKGSLLSLLILGSVFALAAVSLASLAALWCRDETGFTQFSLSYTVPAFVFSGYTWPLQAMDSIAQCIAALFPLTYFADTVRALMISGTAPGWQFQALILLMLAAALLLFSSWRRSVQAQKTAADQATAAI